MATLEETAASRAELDAKCKWCDGHYNHNERLEEIRRQNQERGLTVEGSAPDYCSNSCWISSVKID